jgi:hypothetical protein
MLLLEQKIRIMEHKNLGERVFAAERINKKRKVASRDLSSKGRSMNLSCKFGNEMIYYR